MIIFPKSFNRSEARTTSGENGSAQGQDAPALIDDLRAALINDLHLGRLTAGDKLTSIRRIARNRGVDHRLVADAYHQLAEEGLVEVRGRSGVCVAPDFMERQARRELNDAALWMADVMGDAWERQISFEQLARIVSTCAETGGLRCACVESNADQMMAYATEISESSGLDVKEVFIEHSTSRAAEKRNGQLLDSSLDDVDLVVTTLYHSPVVRDAAERVGMPCVIMRINAEMVAAVRERIIQAPLTIVALSAEFGERMRMMYADVLTDPARIRVVLASDPGVSEVLGSEEPILLTRAARAALDEPVHAPLLVSHSPTLAPETVRELTAAIVQVRIAKMPIPSPALTAR
jgi:DNA-binding transcriptional regulator YhcF (GntR family)